MAADRNNLYTVSSGDANTFKKITITKTFIANENGAATWGGLKLRKKKEQAMADIL